MPAFAAVPVGIEAGPAAKAATSAAEVSTYASTVWGRPYFWLIDLDPFAGLCSWSEVPDQPIGGGHKLITEWASHSLRWLT